MATATSFVSPVVRTLLNSDVSSSKEFRSTSRYKTSLTLPRGGDNWRGFVGLRPSRSWRQKIDRRSEESLALRPSRSWRNACGNVLENAAVLASNKEPAKYEVNF